MELHTIYISALGQKFKMNQETTKETVKEDEFQNSVIKLHLESRSRLVHKLRVMDSKIASLRREMEAVRKERESYNVQQRRQRTNLELQVEVLFRQRRESVKKILSAQADSRNARENLKKIQLEYKKAMKQLDTVERDRKNLIFTKGQLSKQLQAVNKELNDVKTVMESKLQVTADGLLKLKSQYNSVMAKQYKQRASSLDRKVKCPERYCRIPRPGMHHKEARRLADPLVSVDCRKCSENQCSDNYSECLKLLVGGDESVVNDTKEKERVFVRVTNDLGIQTEESIASYDSKVKQYHSVSVQVGEDSVRGQNTCVGEQVHIGTEPYLRCSTGVITNSDQCRSSSIQSSDSSATHRRRSVDTNDSNAKPKSKKNRSPRRKCNTADRDVVRKADTTGDESFNIQKWTDQNVFSPQKLDIKRVQRTLQTFERNMKISISKIGLSESSGETTTDVDDSHSKHNRFSNYLSKLTNRCTSIPKQADICTLVTSSENLLASEAEDPRHKINCQSLSEKDTYCGSGQDSPKQITSTSDRASKDERNIAQSSTRTDVGIIDNSTLVSMSDNMTSECSISVYTCASCALKASLSTNLDCGASCLSWDLNSRQNVQNTQVTNYSNISLDERISINSLPSSVSQQVFPHRINTTDFFCGDGCRSNDESRSDIGSNLSVDEKESRLFRTNSEKRWLSDSPEFKEFLRTLSDEQIKSINSRAGTDFTDTDTDCETNKNHVQL